jgi:hypothetical protein
MQTVSRRRSISTDISVDPKIAELSEQGLLPVLLYTWAIPHADDSGQLSGEPLKFKLQVCPGLPVSMSDVNAAITQIEAAGLWERKEVNGRLTIVFPQDAWYRHQSYIPKHKRETAQNTEDRREVPQNASSPSPSLSPSPSHSPSLSGVETDSTTDLTPSERKILSTLKDTPNYKFNYEEDLSYIRILTVDFPEIDVSEQIQRWRDHKRDKPLTKNGNHRLGLRNWMKKAVEFGMKNGTLKAKGTAGGFDPQNIGAIDV